MLGGRWRIGDDRRRRRGCAGNVGIGNHSGGVGGVTHLGQRGGSGAHGGHAGNGADVGGNGARDRQRGWGGGGGALMTELNGLAGAGINGAQVYVVERLGADDVGDDEEDQFVVGDGVIFGTEEVFEDGDGAEAGDAIPA